MDFTITHLRPTHVKDLFQCGNDILDNYIRFQAGQDVKRRLSTCFVLIDHEEKVKGYYTLSNAGISRDVLPVYLSKKLPKSYPNLPATLIGRFAIDKSLSGMGLGKLLLIDALKRCYQVSLSEIGAMAVIVDPIDEQAIQFYKKYGFILLPDSGKMFLSIKTIADLIND